MGWNYEEKGRRLLVEFKCQRCGKIHLQPLKEAAHYSGDHYEYLHNLRVPKGWDDHIYTGYLICDTCLEKFKSFMAPKEEETETGLLED